MADLEEQSNYESGIYQLETTDPVVGGPSGISNLQAKQLANRTAWLKAQVDQLLANGATSAEIATAITNAIDAHEAAADPHSQYATDTDLSDAVDALTILINQAAQLPAKALTTDASKQLTVGFTTTNDVLTSNVIAPDMTKQVIKTRAVDGDITINFPTGGNAVCYLVLKIDGTDRNVTLGTNVEPIGEVPTLLANGKYIVLVIRDEADEAQVQFAKAGAE